MITAAVNSGCGEGGGELGDRSEGGDEHQELQLLRAQMGEVGQADRQALQRRISPSLWRFHLLLLVNLQYASLACASDRLKMGRVNLHYF